MSSRSDPLPPDRTRSFATAGGVGVDSAAHTRLKELAESAPSTDAAEVTPTPFDRPLPPQYQFIRPLGRGGMGEVVLAFDTRLRRHVALKFMLQKAAISPFARQRFVKEARVLAQLDHPNVVKVHEWDVFEGEPYFVMAYLDGHPLNVRREEFRTSAGRVVGVIAEIAAGLQHVHQNGVYHRDLKASNVVFSDGHPVITDFGCAKYDDGEQSTQGYALLGTPSHMAPEVLEQGSKEHDARADLWSLGVMLYHLLAGELPFAGDPRSGTDRTKLLTEDPAPLRECEKCVPGVDDRLEAIVRKTLAKNPGERYQSAAELAAELEAWRTGGVLKTPVAPPKRPRRQWAWAVVAAAVLLTTGLALVVAVWPKPTVAERAKLGPVELIDAKGRLTIPLTKTPESNGGFETSPTESALLASSGGLLIARFEGVHLTPPYRVTADVHNLTGNWVTEVGLFAREATHPNGSHGLYLLSLCADPIAAGAKDLGTPRVIASGVWATPSDPDGPLNRIMGDRKDRSIPRHPAEVENTPREYRTLELRVYQDRILTRYQGQPLATARFDQLLRGATSSFATQEESTPDPLFGDGIGILVCNGSVLIRNLTVQSIPPEE